MSKMTDESVAKALGWKHVFTTAEGTWGTTIIGGHKFEALRTPLWTQSLDAIVAELEARWLFWEVTSGKLACYAKVWREDHRHKASPGQNETPALALCAALCEYLKQAPMMKENGR